MLNVGCWRSLGVIVADGANSTALNEFAFDEKGEKGFSESGERTMFSDRGDPSGSGALADLGEDENVLASVIGSSLSASSLPSTAEVFTLVTPGVGTWNWNCGVTGSSRFLS